MGTVETRIRQGVLLNIGIVAHTSRVDQALALAETVGAQFISVDDGTLGCTANHYTVWQHLSMQHGEFSIVLEDDAIPIADFHVQLTQALMVAPAPIVSLYLGRLWPPNWQQRIQQALQPNTTWIIGSALLHAVGVVIRTDLIPDMLTHRSPKTAIDQRITAWARERGHQVAYTNPSLVDHADQPTLADHPDRQPRQPGRIAWNVGTRDNWDDTATELVNWWTKPKPLTPRTIKTK